MNLNKNVVFRVAKTFPMLNLTINLLNSRFILAGLVLVFSMNLMCNIHLFGFLPNDDCNCNINRPNSTGLKTTTDTDTDLEKVENSEFKHTDILIDKTVAMDDPLLVDAVRKLLIPPSTLHYNFELGKRFLQRGYNPSAGQTQSVADILKSFGVDGFYIEFGAEDGEWYSNTWWIERTLGWKGLLIEIDPNEYSMLQEKHRNAWTANLCLSKNRSPTRRVHYRIGEQDDFYQLLHAMDNPIWLQCIPLYTLLLAVGRTTVDFITIDDGEGREIEILKTLPFHKVIFKIMSIEYIGNNIQKSRLLKLLTRKGYILYRVFKDLERYANGCVFIHKSVARTLTRKQNRTIGRHGKFDVSQTDDFYVARQLE